MRPAAYAQNAGSVYMTPLDRAIQDAKGRLAYAVPEHQHEARKTLIKLRFQRGDYPMLQTMDDDTLERMARAMEVEGEDVSEMKPWPEKPKFPPEFNANSDHYRAAQLDYQRARADAWEARCRVAVDSLASAYGYFVHYQGELDGRGEAAHHALFTALEAIGDLPPSTEKQP